MFDGIGGLGVWELREKGGAQWYLRGMINSGLVEELENIRALSILFNSVPTLESRNVLAANARFKGWQTSL